MAFKFVVLCAFVALANAGDLGHAPLLAAPQLTYAAPQVAYAAKVAQPEPYDANPQYSFGYDIQDSLSGDVKSQQEQRSGDVVQGSYSLIDADGHRRTVDYAADPVHGFNAVVRREPLGVKTAVVQKVAQPIAYAQPAQLLQKVAQPVAYAQPIAYAQPAQLLQKVAQPIAYAQPAQLLQKVAHPIAYAQPALYH